MKVWFANWYPFCGLDNQNLTMKTNHVLHCNWSGRSECQWKGRYSKIYVSDIARTPETIMDSYGLQIQISAHNIEDNVIRYDHVYENIWKYLTQSFLPAVAFSRQKSQYPLLNFFSQTHGFATKVWFDNQIMTKWLGNLWATINQG